MEVRTDIPQLCSTFDSIILHLTYFACISVPKTLLSLCAGLLPPTWFQFEVSEVLPPNTCRNEDRGRLCSYPGPAIYPSPRGHFYGRMLSPGAVLLPRPNTLIVWIPRQPFPPSQKTRKLSSTTFTKASIPGTYRSYCWDILRGYGQPAVVDRITKRIGDEVLFGAGPLWEKWPDRLRRWLLRRDRPRSDEPWRRSPLWLILRVTLQTSLRLSTQYKPFIHFFHAHLLRSCVRSDSSELKEDPRDHYHDPMTERFSPYVFAVLLPIYLCTVFQRSQNDSYVRFPMQDVIELYGHRHCTGQSHLHGVRRTKQLPNNHFRTPYATQFSFDGTKHSRLRHAV